MRKRHLAAAAVVSFSVASLSQVSATAASNRAATSIAPPVSATRTSQAAGATEAAVNDMNGDGVADLLTVGDTTGLGPGLWLGAGKPDSAGTGGTGLVTLPVTNIGINGAGFNSPGTPSDFDGGQAITGAFTGGKFQDVLVYFPAGNNAGGGMVISGSGDGSPLVPQSDDIANGSLADVNGDNPLEVVNAYASILGQGLPDLIAINGDSTNGYHLDYFDAFGVPAAFGSLNAGFYDGAFQTSTLTPDGTSDWNDWTIATTNVVSGPAMFLWNKTSGTLYLWSDLTATDNSDGTGSFAYTQYLISAHWNLGADLSTLEAADINGDGVPDVWAVTPTGRATSYLVSHLSTRQAATIEQKDTQDLATS